MTDDGGLSRDVDDVTARSPSAGDEPNASLLRATSGSLRFLAFGGNRKAGCRSAEGTVAPKLACRRDDDPAKTSLLPAPLMEIWWQRRSGGGAATKDTIVGLPAEHVAHPVPPGHRGCDGLTDQARRLLVRAAAGVRVVQRLLFGSQCGFP